jgi:hypothetical protein
MSPTSNIVMGFSAGFIDNQTMNLVIYNNDQVIYQNYNIIDSRFVVEFESCLPSTLCIDVSEKGPNDTKVDDQGNILADKFIKLDYFNVDQMPVKSWILENGLIHFLTEHRQELKTNYFGFNGRATIDLNHTDSFEFHLAQLART